MSELDDAMREHMAYLVFVDYRPFSYKDFLSFEVNGKLFRMAYRTFRNKISKMRQNDEVELYIKSSPNFYTLKGCRFDNGKPMTDNHTEVINTQKIIHHPLYQIFEGTSFGQRAVHDLHLKINIQQIYNSLLNNQEEIKKNINQRNKGIQLNYYDIEKFTIILTVYPNDTCKIVIGCSENPIPLNFEGVNRLATTLCRIEERLSNLCLGCRSIKIPHYKYWIITLWHIGKDSISEYSGKMFHCEWNIAENMILRIYSKTIGKNKKNVRIEIQQNPTLDIQQLIKKLSIEKILE
ncbi:MAG: hypothetical protein ACR2F1_03225 [Nitrososphaeraceae archaeon]